MALNNFIEEYNEDGFVGTVKSVFVRLTGFLTMVAKAKRQSEINIEILKITLIYFIFYQLIVF